MVTWFTLEPRDTLLVRDGRSMNGTVGRSLAFPHPSTLAGLVRTRLGRRNDGSFDASRIRRLLEHVHVSGPLLASLDADGETIAQVYAPAPGDCVWFGPRQERYGLRLGPRSPQEVAPGAHSDLGETLLADFGGASGPTEKAAAGPPYWRWNRCLEWLGSPPIPKGARESARWSHTPDDTGIDEFEREARTHVTIDAESGTADDGALYATESRRWVQREREGGPIVRFALLGSVDTGGEGEVKDAYVPLGGERKGAFLRVRTPPGFECPEAVRSLKKGARARVMLLTPAIFTEGSVPREILGAKVVAACVGRPEVVSGWDFAANGPKPTRRMALGGSVYWVDVPNDEWARTTWATCVSTEAQDRRDGFGLAVVGVA